MPTVCASPLQKGKLESNHILLKSNNSKREHVPSTVSESPNNFKEPVSMNDHKSFYLKNLNDTMTDSFARSKANKLVTHAQ
jgi:hypothetical protein